MNDLKSSHLAAQIFAKMNASSYSKSLRSCSEASSVGNSLPAPPNFSEETIKLYRASILDLYQFYLGTYTSLDKLNLKHPELWKGREQALSKLASVKSHITEWWNGIFNPVNNLPLYLADRGKTDILTQMDDVLDELDIVILSPTQEKIKNLQRDFSLLKSELSITSRDAENLLNKLYSSRDYFVKDEREMEKVSKVMFSIDAQYAKKINDLQREIDSCNKEIAIGIGVTVTGGVFILVGVVGAFFSGGSSLALLVPGAGLTSAGAIVIAMAQKEKKAWEGMKKEYSDDKTAIAALAGRLRDICDTKAGSLTKDFENIITPWSQMNSYLSAVVQEVEELKSNNDPQKWQEIKSTFAMVKENWMRYLEELPRLQFDVCAASVSVDPFASPSEVKELLSQAKAIPMSEWHAA